MYLVTVLPVTAGNQHIRSYWCGGRQWTVGNTKVPDSEMTPELLAAIEFDSKVVGSRYTREGGEEPIYGGMRRITVEHLEGVDLPKPKKPKSESDKS